MTDQPIKTSWSHTPLSRRVALKRGGQLAGAAALMTALRATFPSGVFAQGAGPEITKATFGYIALTDSAPMIIAKEKGFYAKYGMPDVGRLKYFAPTAYSTAIAATFNSAVNARAARGSSVSAYGMAYR